MHPVRSDHTALASVGAWTPRQRVMGFSCPLCELALNEAADLLDATNPEAAEYYRHLYD